MTDKQEEITTKWYEGTVGWLEEIVFSESTSGYRWDNGN